MIPGVEHARMRVDTWVNAITGPATQVVEHQLPCTEEDGSQGTYTVQEDALETLTRELFDKTPWAAIVVALDEGSK